MFSIWMLQARCYVALSTWALQLLYPCNDTCPQGCHDNDYLQSAMDYSRVWYPKRESVRDGAEWGWEYSGFMSERRVWIVKGGCAGNKEGVHEGGECTVRCEWGCVGYERGVMREDVCMIWRRVCMHDMREGMYDMREVCIIWCRVCRNMI
jgi:hypothetical protein